MTKVYLVIGTGGCGCVADKVFRSVWSAMERAAVLNEMYEMLTWTYEELELDERSS